MDVATDSALRGAMLRLVSLLAISFLLVACGEKSVVGRWSSDGKDQVEFTKNGTLLMSDTGRQMSGRWEALENGRISFRFDGIGVFAGAVVCNYNFDGSDLIFENCPLAARLKRAS
jgi:hypothetical protein